MKILHLIDSLGRGGAETLLVNTVLEFHEKHPELKQHVVTLYAGGELLPEIAGKAECFCLDFSLKNPLPAIFKLRKYLKKYQVDVVHSHLLHATFVARLAIPARVGLVSTYHSVFYEPTMVTYAGKELRFDKLTYRPRYYSIFVSDAVQENILKTIGIKQNYRVLLNFASPKFKTVYQYKPAQELRMVMVGNLHEIKNHQIAVKAMARFRDLPVYLDIYGEGPLRSELQNLINKTQVKVTLHGKTAMSSDILGRYDLFLMTSHHEGMPLSLLEALQTGLPALLNDVAMLKETAGPAAIYYDYDSQLSLEEKIAQVFQDKSRLAELAQNARKQALNYSAANYTRELLQIYDSVSVQNQN
jgi:glycosyltransferase involved in cell wall biosynthesis